MKRPNILFILADDMGYSDKFVMPAELPEVVERLKTAWQKWADRCGVLPLPIKRK
jgi:arylsulfatase A-like enzyme